MGIVIRRGELEDAAQYTTIFYEAFKAIAEQHNIPIDILPPDSETVSSRPKRFTNPAFYEVVAKLEGCIVGSNILDERDSIASVGPLTVDPLVQTTALADS